MATPTRRTFLGQLAVGTAVASLATPIRGSSPNEEIRYGLIGCGQRGRWFFERATSVCDPDRSRLEAAATQAGADSAHAVTDMRRILDDPDIDAVVIATPDHWHAPAAILACEAGKHVYLEKPGSHNFREAELVFEAAQRNKVVVQHGTQQRSTPFTMEAIGLLHEGLIGEVLMAKAWNIQRRKNIGHGKPTAPPPEVDYDMWVGPAEFEPFQENRFHSDWRWWRNFGTGDIGNDGAHELDYARWGLGVDTMPSRVVAIGGKYFYDDDQQYPDTATCIFEYPGDGKVGSQRQLVFEMMLWTRNYPWNCDSGVEFFGTEGKMLLSKRGKLRVVDQSNAIVLEKRKEDTSQLVHLDNFLNAIRNGHAPNANIHEGLRSAALIHLAKIALATGRSLDFDTKTHKIANDDQANRLLSRAYRSDGHWAIPQGVR